MSGQRRSCRVGSGRVGSGQRRSGRVGSAQVGSGRVGSGRVGSGQVRSSQVRVFNVHIQRKVGKCFYLTTHSTHFIYGYMASDIIMVKDHSVSYSFRLAARVLLYASPPQTV